MSQRIESLDDPAFAALFTSFDHTAYRLELLPNYDVGYEDASFAAWREGENPADPSMAEWSAVIRHARAEGKLFQRVHLVDDSKPLSPYLLYEMEVWYTANEVAGDDVRILLASDWRASEGHPDGDHWLFDSRELWAMEYEPDGRFVACELVDDPAEVVQHNYWRDAAMHYAIPFREYAARIPELRQAA